MLNSKLILATVAAIAVLASGCGVDEDNLICLVDNKLYIYHGEGDPLYDALAAETQADAQEWIDNLEYLQDCECGCAKGSKDCADCDAEEKRDDDDEKVECHSTGTIRCRSGALWRVRECSDGSEKFIFGYDCPCSCVYGTNYCKYCY
ncbi:MAG: hypothetical protein JRF33_11585 [Deltaproteobacteria bacterium]|nr:hypothetical protein [Deltaproteobacteria bacterium]